MPAGTNPSPLSDACDWFAGVDVCLLDVVLRGRIRPTARVLDAGCGTGRNLTPFLRGCFHVLALDARARAVERTRARFRELAPHLPPGNVRVGALEDLPPSRDFDVVIAVAVLHFAREQRTSTRCSRACGARSRPAGSSSCALPRAPASRAC